MEILSALDQSIKALIVLLLAFGLLVLYVLGVSALEHRRGRK